MRTISLKRAKELRQYSKIKKLWRAENPLCKVCWDQGFASTAMNEPHHVKGRFGKRLNDTEYRFGRALAIPLRIISSLEYSPENVMALILQKTSKA